MKRSTYLWSTVCTALLTFPLFAQEDLSKMFEDSAIVPERSPVYASFKSTRIVSANSNETIRKHELDFTVTHRFGDAAGEYGGVHTFYGTDNSSDIKIGFDYGITDNWTVGVSRAKGATAIRELYEVSTKYKLLQQTTDNHMPISVTLFGNAVASGMVSNVNPTVPDHFETFSDRLSFVVQPIFVRKFNKRLTLAFLPTYVHYNRVGYGDQNDTYSLGLGGRFKFSKRMSLIVDYFYVFKEEAVRGYFEANGMLFYNPLGIGLEVETGGHVFHITFTNSTAILENQFIPYTTSSWTKGQFRWGFIISRTFAFGAHNDKVKTW